MKKIIFLCHGNICRSPMAEFVMKKLASEAGMGDALVIESAATSREEIGNDMYPPAQRCLRSHGVPFTHRRARQVTPEDYAEKLRPVLGELAPGDYRIKTHVSAHAEEGAAYTDYMLYAYFIVR